MGSITNQKTIGHIMGHVELMKPHPSRLSWPHEGRSINSRKHARLACGNI